MKYRKRRLLGYHSGSSAKQRHMITTFLNGAVKCAHRSVGIAQPPNMPASQDITAVFGLSRPTMKAWREIQKHNRPFIYIDNCYMGKSREYYRVTPQALMAQTFEQHPGMESQGRRFEVLDIHPKPWRKDGNHIVVVLQSRLYFELVVGKPRDQWVTEVCTEIRKYTDRPIIVREKPTRENPQPDLQVHLDRCHALVTWNSTAAVHAMIKGVPAICVDPHNSFRSVCSGDLSTIDNPVKKDGRRELFHWLADNQWTKTEILTGLCWSAIRGYL